MQDIPAPPPPPAPALAQTNQQAAIDLIQAQIAGLKKEIGDLTRQLVPGTTDARESIIESQIESATERLQSLESQLDRVVSGETSALAFEPAAPPNDVPRGVIDMIEIVATGAVIIALGIPLMRVLARRLEPRQNAQPPADDGRLERLEHAVDAIAIEVERISEGQRYTNKLLTDVKALPAPNPLEQWPLKAKSEQQVK